ncbi:MAG: pantetheine-phosphate adenylyltransferase [Actinomycetota bacterium]
MAIALCPGSFDPPTYGHIDVIERAAKHFTSVVVVVVVNPSKVPWFDEAERVTLLKEVLGHLPNVEIESHSGLLVEFAKQKGADVIVKGLRAISDIEYELQMAQMNSSLYEDVDTMFITTNPRWGFVSSSLVKEVASYGGNVSALVPPTVDQALSRRSKG